MDRVMEIQKDHMDDGWDDIGYNFLIDGYGNVYVGRGWDNEGAHTSGYNDVAIGINFLGYFEDDLPTSAALETGKNLIACGVTMGKIKSGYDLNCHSDLGASSGGTDCPRAALCLYATERLRPSVKLINSSWPHVQLLHVKRILRF
ncbi:peptidoglycan-recognition protein SC2-like [Branchiostoma floridae]|uniref:Peptidoglycan-recognition protein SC2-like n=1 Tax=Branchiostoma floridae TaxID=7739 RepID=A0A9J7KKR2_BRAFL|nr:peptidoglycan-recognition protein SC2-like [Branchiostoma floridae]